MATHSSILAWRIPWTEYGGLQFMGSQKVRHQEQLTVSLSGKFTIPKRTNIELFIWVFRTILSFSSSKIRFYESLTGVIY